MCQSLDFLLNLVVLIEVNLTVNDIEFAKAKVIVQPKRHSDYTWRWVVKDKDRRELPLIDEASALLIDLQAQMPEGHPYLLLPPGRYKLLMGLKKSGKLTDRVAKCPDSNFRRNWLVIRRRAGITDITFHDLRATCITEWFEQGMMPHEIQKLAGHSSINTSMKYYVGIRESMIDRARLASSAALTGNSVANLLQTGKYVAFSKNKAIPNDSQHLGTAALTKLGATGLEPATS